MTFEHASKAVMFALVALSFPLLGPQSSGQEVRIKDIADIEGHRENTLVGYGLVTGLNGTGGNSPATREAMANLLQRLGQRLDPTIRARIRNDTQQKTDNVSLVMVSAQLPVNARPGQKVDVTVSALDDAESLAGGELILTPLLGVDNEYYGTASGWVSTNSFDFGGEAASVEKNHPTSGRIPNGLTVEKAVPITDHHPDYINLLLRRSDIQTAKRVVEAINAFAPDSAVPISHGVIKVTTPVDPHQRLNFLASVEMLTIVPDRVARIVINERTGTVVIGDNVKISGISVAHGNLSVTTAETPEVSQPLPRSRGQTVVVPRTEVEVIEDDRQMQVIESTATIADLTDALNALGVTPRDLSSVFQMLKEQGALHAELELR